MSDVAKSVFVAGVDAGVGKTFVALGMVKTLRQEGRDIGVMKPFETKGCPSPDAAALVEAAGVADPPDLVNPCCYGGNVSPFAAAVRDDRPVDIEGISQKMAELSSRHEVLIIEGVGGIMTPLAHRVLLLDFAVAMRLPTILVARPYIGTIDYTIMVARGMRASGVDLRGVIFNHARPPTDDQAVQRHPEEIQAAAGVPVLAVVPYAPAARRGEGS